MMLVHLHPCHTEESHFGSFSCPLSPFNPSICFFFFPKQCVSDTCNIPVAGVSARDLLLDLSLLTLSATCPLFLWGFYYKTAIAPLINTRYKFNPRSPDHCTRVVPWVFRHLSTLNVICELYFGTNVCLPNVAWRPVRQDEAHLLAASLLEMKPPGIWVTM